jgi:hypothetical protein
MIIRRPHEERGENDGVDAQPAGDNDPQYNLGQQRGWVFRSFYSSRNGWIVLRRHYQTSGSPAYSIESCLFDH